MMKDAELRMPPFAMKIEIALIIFVEIDAPTDQLFNLRRGFPDDLFNYRFIAQAGARVERIGNMFFEIVPRIGNGSDPALRIKRIGIFQRIFRNDGDFSMSGNFQRITHPRNTGSYDQKIICINHVL